MLKGIFAVWFNAPDTDCKGQGVVVLPGDGTLYGGDQTFTYVGMVTETEKGKGRVDLTIARYGGEPGEKSGAESEIELHLEGFISQIPESTVSFTLYGHIGGDESQKLTAQGHKVREF